MLLEFEPALMKWKAEKLRRIFSIPVVEHK